MSTESMRERLARLESAKFDRPTDTGSIYNPDLPTVRVGDWPRQEISINYRSEQAGLTTAGGPASTESAEELAERQREWKETLRIMDEAEKRGSLSEWQNPEPGVLTWRCYQIQRRHTGRLALYSNISTMDIGEGSLTDLKALAERDYDERVEMGEVEAPKRVCRACTAPIQDDSRPCRVCGR